MPKAAKPYLHGTGWCMRRRYKGHELFVSGKKSEAAAFKAMQSQVDALDIRGAPAGLGPHKTSFGQALQDYALNRLRFHKGARQEADRINKLLRAGRLATLKVTPWGKAVAEGRVKDESRVNDRKGRGQVQFVELLPPEPVRRIPKGLSGHRARLAEQTRRSDAARRQLACLAVAEIRRYHVQELLDALRAERREPATLQLEQALYRRFFNYAHTVWNWSEPAENPATQLDLPPVDNQRNRVMSKAEEARLDEAMADCQNSVIGPVVGLLTETGMRTSEPLLHASWKNVDWDRKLLHLSDAKAGKRDVPLSPGAIEALQALRGLNPGAPDEPIVQLTYEALKAAWQRARDRAGLEGLQLRDLRHTAATRMALKTGNVFLVKALTGHKTLKMVERYVNVGAEDAVRVLHEERAPASPAGVKLTEPETPPPESTSEAVRDDDLPVNVVRVSFGRQRVA